MSLNPRVRGRWPVQVSVHLIYPCGEAVNIEARVIATEKGNKLALTGGAGVMVLYQNRRGPYDYPERLPTRSKSREGSGLPERDRQNSSIQGNTPARAFQLKRDPLHQTRRRLVAATKFARCASQSFSPRHCTQRAGPGSRAQEDRISRRYRLDPQSCYPCRIPAWPAQHARFPT